MPRIHVPKYRSTPGRDLARVTLDGKTFYLGKYGSRASKLRYDLLVQEWLRNGRTLAADEHDLSICEKVEAFVTHAGDYYGDTGKRRGVVNNLRPTIRNLVDVFGQDSAISFGPRKLKALQRLWIQEGHARGYVNQQTGRIKRIFRWAVSEELVPPETLQALEAVAGIPRGRCGAREGRAAPVKPVADSVVEATLPYLPRTVAAMVLVQRYTGCRPGEVCRMRAVDIDRSGDVWLYQPSQHKTANKGKPRSVAIGPEAQAVLRRSWKEDGYLFPPTRKKGPPCGPYYTNDSYRRAIHRACQKAGLPKWSPNQLRHQAATEIRRAFDLEHAQASLGHTSPNVTTIYAERDVLRACEVAKRLG